MPGLFPDEGRVTDGLAAGLLILLAVAAIFGTLAVIFT